MIYEIMKNHFSDVFSLKIDFFDFTLTDTFLLRKSSMNAKKSWVTKFVMKQQNRVCFDIFRHCSQLKNST